MNKYMVGGLLVGILIDADRPLSTKQIASYGRFCWKTTRDHLENLFKLGLVCKGRVKNNKRIYWKHAQ